MTHLWTAVVDLEARVIKAELRIQKLEEQIGHDTLPSRLEIDDNDNRKFLLWLKDRLVNVYNESEQTDFIQKLVEIAEEQDKISHPRSSKSVEDCHPHPKGVSYTNEAITSLDRYESILEDILYVYSEILAKERHNTDEVTITAKDVELAMRDIVMMLSIAPEDVFAPTSLPQEIRKILHQIRY